MLLRMGRLSGFRLQAEDAGIGTVRDLLFSDEDWHVRFLVVDTGGGEEARRVMIPKEKLGEPDEESETIPVDLTREEVDLAPHPGLDGRLTRAQENKLRKYYGLAPYGAAERRKGAAGAGEGRRGPLGDALDPARPPLKAPESHLRGCREIAGYDLQAVDGPIGRLEDCVIDVENWTVRYLVADVRAMIPERRVLVAPGWVDEIGWTKKTIRLDLPQEAIEDGPLYEMDQPLTPEYEERLTEHYSHARYWK